MALGKTISHPSAYVRWQIHLNHNKAAENQLNFFCDLQSFLISGKCTAQINGRWLYEIILKFKYLTAASIGMKSFPQILHILFQALTRVFVCSQMESQFVKLSSKQIFGHDTHKKSFLLQGVTSGYVSHDY